MKEETQKAYTYLKQEAPEVGREYVQWKMAESAISAAAFIAISILLAVICEKLRRAGTRCKPDPFGPNPYYIMSGGVLVVAIWLAGESVPFVIKTTKCIVAPRIVIIEGIKEIVK